MTERFHLLRGLSFCTLEWGDPADRPVVLLHGWLDSAAVWAEIAPQLGGWRIALDQRGHGRSAHTAPGHTHFFPEYVADLDALVAWIGRPVDLVGHSMGGTLSTMYAAARPDHVRRIVILDGLGLHDGVEEVPDRLVAYLDGQSRVPPHKVYPDLDAVVSRLRLQSPRLTEAHARLIAAHTTVDVPGGVTWRMDPRHRQKGVLPYRQDQHRRLLERVRCPVLSVHPEHSPFADADVTRLESAVADLHVVQVPGVGHRLHLDAPDAVAAAISAFLDGPTA